MSRQNWEIGRPLVLGIKTTCYHASEPGQAGLRNPGSPAAWRRKYRPPGSEGRGRRLGRLGAGPRLRLRARWILAPVPRTGLIGYVFGLLLFWTSAGPKNNTPRACRDVWRLSIQQGILMMHSAGRKYYFVCDVVGIRIHLPK